MMLALKSGPQIAAKVGNPAGLLCLRIWYSVGKSGVFGITEYRQGRPLPAYCASATAGSSQEPWPAYCDSATAGSSQEPWPAFPASATAGSSQEPCVCS